jgi:hypothetical protein
MAHFQQSPARHCSLHHSAPTSATSGARIRRGTLPGARGLVARGARHWASSSQNATDVDHPRRTIRHRVGPSGPLPRGERDPVSPRTARTPLDRPGNGQPALRRGRRRLAGSHSARIRGRDRRSTTPLRYRSFRWQPSAGRSGYPRFHGAPDPVSRTVSPEGRDDVRSTRASVEFPGGVTSLRLAASRQFEVRCRTVVPSVPVIYHAEARATMASQERDFTPLSWRVACRGVRQATGSLAGRSLGPPSTVEVQETSGRCPVAHTEA